MILHGRCVSPGVAQGHAIVHDSQTPLLQATSIPSLLPVSSEIERFRAAVSRAKAQLERLHQQLTTRGLTQHAAIFSVHASVMTDDSLTDQIEAGIAQENLSAEAAVARAILGWHTRFSASPHAMVQEKASDILDTGQRMLRCLNPTRELESIAGGIVVAAEITPSEIVRFAHQGIHAVVTESCGMKSHTAILSRGFGIPTVTGIDSATSVLPHGAEILLDADAGILVVDPNELEQETVECIAEKIKRAEDQPPATREPITRDGVRVTVLLNISGLMEAEMVAQLGADGVGLYRTEFLYLDYERWPTEEESFGVYHRVAQAVGDRELNIRLADFGAEKSPRYADIPINRNPSLGIRGMRLLLGREDILRPQILAIERMAHDRPVTVLLPMIDTTDTLQKTVKKLCQFCRSPDREHLPFRLGIMIEVPSAAYLVAELIEHVDSVSIGLNDLTQYMLAADRDDELVEAYHDPLQPPILRIVAETIRVADSCGKPVTMCGELAGDRELAVALFTLGARRFSVSRSHYFKTVDLLRNMSVRESALTAEKLLRLSSGAAVRQFLSERFQRDERRCGESSY